MTDPQPQSQPQPPANLPPVEPPSVGFIFQLFVIPGLIVLVLVLSWFFLSRLAEGDKDFQVILTELNHPTEEIRWRAAHGLAQLLISDQQEQGGISSNAEVAEKLASSLKSELERRSDLEKDIKHQEFLALALGMTKQIDTVIPVLLMGMDPKYDRTIRKSALASLARLAERAELIKHPWPPNQFVEQLIEVSGDQDVLIRQLAAVNLGLAKTPQALERLNVMVSDSDRDVRLNAAIALARNESLEGVKVLLDSLNEEPAKEPDQEQLRRIVNSLRAVVKLQDQLKGEQRFKIVEAIKKLEKASSPRISLDAASTLREIGE